MTKVMLRIDENGLIFFDCLNHCNDYTVCAIISTLANVLVEACYRAGHEPTIYNKGHVRIDIPKAEYPTIEVFRIVDKGFRQVAEQYPDLVRLY